LLTLEDPLSTEPLSEAQLLLSAVWQQILKFKESTSNNWLLDYHNPVEYTVT